MVTFSTLLYLDAAEEAGRDVNWLYVLWRKSIDWILWGLAAEPILLLARFLSRHVKWVALLVVLHSGIAYGVARGLAEAETYVAYEWLYSPLSSQGIAEGRRAEGQRPEGPRPEGQRGDGQRSPSADFFRRRMRRFPGPRVELGVLLYLVILGMGWGARSYLIERDVERHAAYLELRAARLEAELSSAKVASLEGQLQPHFLFNALHSVGGLIRSGQSAEAISSLSALGGLLRATLDHGDDPEVEFEQELALAQHYLDIEAIRLGERLQVDTHIAPGLASARVPALLLLPLVENAVKYAVAPRPEGGRLEIRAEREGDQLHVTVSDDGPGFPDHVIAGKAQTEGDRSPIGIENTRARLETLYGHDGTLELLSRPEGGATVHVRLPFEELPA